MADFDTNLENMFRLNLLHSSHLQLPIQENLQADCCLVHVSKNSFQVCFLSKDTLSHILEYGCCLENLIKISLTEITLKYRKLVDVPQNQAPHHHHTNSIVNISPHHFTGI